MRRTKKTKTTKPSKAKIGPLHPDAVAGFAQLGSDLTAIKRAISLKSNVLIEQVHEQTLAIFTLAKQTHDLLISLDKLLREELSDPLEAVAQSEAVAQYIELAR